MTENESKANGWNEWARHVLSELKRLDASINCNVSAMTQLREDFATYRAERTAMLDALREEFRVFKAEMRGEDVEKDKKLTGPQMVVLAIGIIQLALLANQLLNP